MEPGHPRLLFKDEVFRIVGCAIEVLNGLGNGIVEKPYENALVVEFRLRAIPFRQQPAFDLFYKEIKVGLFIPDLIFRRDCRRHQDHRSNHRARARVNVELFANYQTAGRSDFEL